MKNFKTVVAVMAVLMLFAVGCSDSVGSGETNVTVTYPEEGIALNGSSISIVSTNLGQTAGIVTASYNDLITSGTAPFVPVYKSDLIDSSTGTDRPYVTFTFNKNISAIYETVTGPVARAASFNEDKYVFHLDESVTPVVNSMFISEVSGTGTVVSIYLPAIESGFTAGSDEELFIVGQKYIVDFMVVAEDGDYGQVTIGFEVREPATPLGDLVESSIAVDSNGYALYLLDGNKVFYLNDIVPADHLDPQIPAESITAGSTYTTYANRIGAGTNASLAATGEYRYDSLEALAFNTAVATNRTSDFVRLTWDAVAGADSYRIYTTDNADQVSGWEFVGTTIINSFDFDISATNSHFIDADRYVRVVPVQGNRWGAAGEFRLVDTVRPVTSVLNEDNAANNYLGNASFVNHDEALAAEGEIVAVGTKWLLDPTLLIQNDTDSEAIQVVNVTGSFSVTTTAVNGQVMTINTADIPAEIVGENAVYQLGANAVGVLDAAGYLTVFVRLKCHMPAPAGGTITYTDGDTPITCTALSVQYQDMSGNNIISRYADGTSNNNGSVIWVEN